MKRRLLTPLALFVVPMLILAGCSKPPTTEVQAAQDAIQKAQAAEAGTYAPEALSKAQAAQTALDTEMKAQEQKFALFRKYDQAKTLAMDAQQTAQAAADEAGANKQRFKTETETMMAEVTTMLHETEAMLSTAPVGKGTTLDLQVMRTDLEGANSAITEAKALYDQEKFADAKNKLTSAQSTIEQVKTSIEQAQAAKKGKAS